MQIVIDIPEEDYNLAKKQVADGITNPLKMSIASGTPLPKHHGRLVDISPYEQREAFATSWMLTRKIGQIVKDEECIPLFELPTIIEADLSTGSSTGLTTLVKESTT